MKNRPLAICLTCGAALLYFSLLIPLPLTAGLPTDQPLSSPSILSDTADSLPGRGAMTSTYYLPIVTNPPIIAYQPRELHGYVTVNGQPAQNISISLVLKFYRWSYAVRLWASMKTDVNGLYSFTGFPSVTCDPLYAPLYCWGYYIEYSGPDLPGYMEYWETTPITEYVQGTTQQYPTFDISAPVLLFPRAGDVVSPTLTFTWIPRALPTDNYELEIWADGSPDPDIYIANLGYTNAYSANFVGNNCGGPCANLYNRPLRWRLFLRQSVVRGQGYMRATGFFTITAP